MVGDLSQPEGVLKMRDALWFALYAVTGVGVLVALAAVVAVGALVADTVMHRLQQRAAWKALPDEVGRFLADQAGAPRSW